MMEQQTAVVCAVLALAAAMCLHGQLSITEIVRLRGGAAVIAMLIPLTLTPVGRGMVAAALRGGAVQADR
ncbi:hypothetical protein [Streptomyces subrutilus]|uniref:hypothetical protein n=1 Tax=Streptomyces subrutilus TaxID=36818 RepID=UPI00340E7705